MADEIIWDLTNFKDRTGSRVPPGRYKVIVDDVEVTKAQESGNEMANLWLRILEGEHEGEIIIDRLVNSPGAMFRAVGFMQAIGMKTPKQKLKTNPYQFKGKVLEVDVDDDEYRGRIRSAVRGYMRATGTTGATPTTDLEDLPGEDNLSAFTGEAQAEAAAPTADQAPEAPVSADDPVAPAPPAVVNTDAPASPAPPETAAPAADEIELDAIDLS